MAQGERVMARIRSLTVVAAVALALVAGAGCSSSSDAGGSSTDDTAAVVDTTDSGTTTEAPTTGSPDTGGTPVGTPGHPNDAAGLEAAATDYTTRLIAEDPSSGYAYLTEACHAQVTQADFVAEVKDSFDLLKTISSNGDQVQVGAAESRNVADGKGEVTVALLGSDGQPLGADDTSVTTTVNFLPWVYEGGEWRPVQCSSGGGGSADGGTASTSS